MAFGGSLPEWKKFVKSKSGDETDTNLSSSSGLTSKTSERFPNVSATGDDARKTYEDIVGDGLNPSLKCASTGGKVPEDDSEPELSVPLDVKGEKHCASKFTPVPQPAAGRIEPRPSLSTLMQHVERNDFKKVSEAINQDGSLTDAVDQFGWSLLMVAACAGAVETVHLLLQSGADTRLRDKSGHTCVSLARKKGHLNIVNVIKKFRSRDHRAAQSDKAVQKDRTSLPKLEVCAACNVSIHQSQKKNHLTSTVHQLSRCVRECRTHYSILGNNRGYQLMLKSGWDGEKGLGPSGSGVKLPPKTVLKRDRKGLGASKGIARITHFHSKDRNAVARSSIENLNTFQNKAQINKQIQRQKSLEVALRRELS